MNTAIEVTMEEMLVLLGQKEVTIFLLQKQLAEAKAKLAANGKKDGVTDHVDAYVR